jgi:hypothetical protein
MITVEASNILVMASVLPEAQRQAEQFFGCARFRTHSRAQR